MPREYSGLFLRDLIHDMINPLSSLVGFLDMLLSPGATDPLTQRQKRMLVTMDKACTHFLGMMRDIADTSRIEDEGLKPSLEPVDLRKVAARVLGEYALLAENRRIAMTLDGPPEGPLVSGDERMLERFFDALLRAAGRLTPENGTILLHLAREGGGASGSLEHSGDTLAPDVWEAAFGTSLGGPRPAEGYVMIGAALSRMIARLHGGDVSASPRPGGGTVFRFRLS